MLRSGEFELSGKYYRLSFDLNIEITDFGHTVNVFSLWGDFLGVIRVNGCGQVVSVEKVTPFKTCDDFDDDGDPLPCNFRSYTALEIARAVNIVAMFLDVVN